MRLRITCFFASLKSWGAPLLRERFMITSSLFAANPRLDGYDSFAAEARLLISSTLRRDRQPDRLWAADLYWKLGRLIASRQRRHAWKGGVIKELAEDLQEWFPGVAGLSCRNLQYMRAFARAWPDGPGASPGVAALPWGHITVLLDSVPDVARRNELAAEALRNGWSRTQLQERAGRTAVRRPVGS